MADYVTKDGKTFTLRSDAQEHANELAAYDARVEANAAAARDKNIADYKYYLDLYNKSDWDALISPSAQLWDWDVIVGSENAAVLRLAWAVAYGKKGNYKKAYEYFLPLVLDPKPSITEREIFTNAAAAAKQAWENAHGREMTKADLNVLIAERYETLIGYTARHNYSALSDDNKIKLKSYIAGWEAATGKRYKGAMPPGSPRKISPVLRLIIIAVVIILVVYNCVLPRVRSAFPNAPAAATVTVTSDSLNLRAEASGSADIVKGLGKGSVLTVTGEAVGGWLPVEHEGAKGWVWAEYVE